MGSSEQDDRLLEQMSSLESLFLGRRFIAPVVPEGRVRVRIAGVVCRIRVKPADFRGWGILEPTTLSEAQVVRPAEPQERKRYLSLFPTLRMVLCARTQGCWWAIPAEDSDGRFAIEGIVPIHHTESARRFEVVLGRFDGSHCWYESVEPGQRQEHAEYLRKALQQMTHPERLDCLGLSSRQQTAYALNHWSRIRKKVTAGVTVDDRLRGELTEAESRLWEYLERRDRYRVTYVAGGRQRITEVEKRNLKVNSAGICMDGEKGEFDLKSLVGVVRRGPQEGELVYSESKFLR